MKRIGRLVAGGCPSPGRIPPRVPADCSGFNRSYDVYWKVRNDGKEATRLNALRGQIELGNAYRSETTSYRGNHYVEVYIVKDGRCAAVDRQRVTIY